MGDSLQAKFVKCPFYEKDREGYIRCEGITDDCFTQVAFIHPQGNPNFEKKLEFMHTYCIRDYRRCRIYQMLMEKYRYDS